MDDLEEQVLPEVESSEEVEESPAEEATEVASETEPEAA